ncbi:MAG TPA: hypothetical protein P5152_14845 [Candidatus Paceibacterota bacterium]|nr:hypothetical protein [Candidatus Paceibacterota bacterium]
MLYDGDNGWVKVEDRGSPGRLAEGVLALGENVTLEFEDVRPRWGVWEGPWGHVTPNLCEGMVWDFSVPRVMDVPGFELGRTYLFYPGDANVILSSATAWDGSTTVPAGQILTARARFTAEAETYYIWGGFPGEPVRSAIYAAVPPLAFGRYRDPEGYDYLVLVTDEARASDGGWGRAWKLQSGCGPVEIPLNGHDVWGASRLVQSRGALVLLRDGAARYYWTKSGGTPNWDTTQNTLTLNTTDGLFTGDRVLAQYQQGGVSPLAGTSYYISVEADNKVKFYRTRSMALAGAGAASVATASRARSANVATIITGSAHGLETGHVVDIWGLGGAGYNARGVSVTKVDATTFTYANTGADEGTTGDTGGRVSVSIHLDEPVAGTRLYFEKEDPAAAAGQVNEAAARPLVMRSVISGSSVLESWSVGFDSVPYEQVAENTATETEWRSGSHGWLPGQSVKFAADVGGFVAGTEYYVNPLDEHRFTLHASAEEALLGTNPIASSAGTTHTGNLKPTGYSAMPMPGGRAGANAGNRLVIAAGRHGLAVSDPGDYLHFSPYDGAVTANQGESGPTQALVALGQDTLMVLKADAIMAVTGLSGQSSGWMLDTVTREVGCLAPESAVAVGSDCWFLARNGVMSVRQTELGAYQGALVPMSRELARKFLEVDWSRASQACAAWFGNRYLVAVPMLGQTGTVTNNAVFVYNFLTQGWEGYWQGDLLDVAHFAQHEVNGVLRLCYVTSGGTVRYFDETALSDHNGAAIEWRWRSRGYQAGYFGPKNWQELVLTLETWYPRFTVKLLPAGVGEEKTLAGNTQLSRTESFKVATTRTAGDSSAYGKDYAVLAGESGLTAGDDVIVGRFQSVQRRFPLHGIRDRMVQIEVSGDQGSVRCASAALAAAADRPLAAHQP